MSTDLYNKLASLEKRVSALEGKKNPESNPGPKPKPPSGQSTYGWDYHRNKRGVLNWAQHTAFYFTIIKNLMIGWANNNKLNHKKLVIQLGEECDDIIDMIHTEDIKVDTREIMNAIDVIRDILPKFSEKYGRYDPPTSIADTQTLLILNLYDIPKES